MLADPKLDPKLHSMCTEDCPASSPKSGQADMAWGIIPKLHKEDLTVKACRFLIEETHETNSTKQKKHQLCLGWEVFLLLFLLIGHRECHSKIMAETCWCLVQSLFTRLHGTDESAVRRLMHAVRDRHGKLWLICSACCLNFSSIVFPQPLTVNRSCVSIAAPLVEPACQKRNCIQCLQYQKPSMHRDKAVA